VPTFKSFGEFGREIDQMARDIERESKTRIALEMGVRAQAIAKNAASADLGGDPKFSGWKPPLDTHIKKIKDGVVMMPTKSGAGPWTVAEFGRHHGNASGFSGPGINRKTGKTSRTKSGALRKVRAIKGKRWNGYTDPKHTASKAIDRMDRELFPIADRGVRGIQKRHFDVT
jgi:hypothetical protein